MPKKINDKPGISVKLFEASTGKYIESKIFKYKKNTSFNDNTDRLPQSGTNNNYTNVLGARLQEHTHNPPKHHIAHVINHDVINKDKIIEKETKKNS